MYKKIVYFLLALAIVAVAVVPALAKQPSAPADVTLDLPEQAGIYDVPDKPDMKLRVFVYKDYFDKDEKQGKPGNLGKPSPVVPPSLICQISLQGDPDSTAVVNEAGWTLPSSWTYKISVSSVPDTVGKDKIGIITDNSFAEWLEAIGGSISIIRGADTAKNRAQYDGQNIVSWGSTSGTALAVTYIWYNTTTGKAVEIDTIMNKKFKWYWSDPSAWPADEICAYERVYDAQDILTHELGHTMGLDDEYTADYTHNTMYGYGAVSETKKDTLTTGDVIGVTNIY